MLTEGNRHGDPSPMLVLELARPSPFDTFRFLYLPLDFLQNSMRAWCIRLSEARVVIGHSLDSRCLRDFCGKAQGIV